MMIFTGSFEMRIFRTNIDLLVGEIKKWGLLMSGFLPADFEQNIIVGLVEKGLAKKDETGFVVECS